MSYWTKEDHIKLDKHNMIGKGLFSKVFKVSENEVVILTNDNAKECMSCFCQGYKHIPRMERIEDIGEFQAYKMPLYNKLTKKNFPKAWKEYVEINKALKYLRLEKWTCFAACIKAIQDNENLSESLKESLSGLFDMMASYTDEIFLDLAKRNFMVDHEGILILTDIVGSSHELEKQWSQRIKNKKASRFSM